MWVGLCVVIRSDVPHTADQITSISSVKLTSLSIEQCKRLLSEDRVRLGVRRAITGKAHKRAQKAVDKAANAPAGKSKASAAPPPARRSNDPVPPIPGDRTGYEGNTENVYAWLGEDEDGAKQSAHSSRTGTAGGGAPDGGYHQSSGGSAGGEQDSNATGTMVRRDNTGRKWNRGTGSLRAKGAAGNEHLVYDSSPRKLSTDDDVRDLHQFCCVYCHQHIHVCCVLVAIAAPYTLHHCCAGTTGIFLSMLPRLCVRL